MVRVPEDDPSPKRDPGALRQRLLRGLAAPFRAPGRFERLLAVTRLRGQNPRIRHQLVVPHVSVPGLTGPQRRSHAHLLT